MYLIKIKSTIEIILLFLLTYQLGETEIYLVLNTSIIIWTLLDLEILLCHQNFIFAAVWV